MTASRTWTLVAVAGLLIAIGLGVSLVSGGGSGGSSPEDVIESALASATRGDADGVRALIGFDTVFERTVRCRDDKAEEAVKAETAHQIAERIEGHVDGWKGVKTSIVKIEPDGEPSVVEVGAQVGVGCGAKVEYRAVAFRAVVKTTVGDQSEKEHDLDFELIEVGGRWYLDQLPAGPGAAR
jgi:hypothetical protein